MNKPSETAVFECFTSIVNQTWSLKIEQNKGKLRSSDSFDKRKLVK